MTGYIRIRTRQHVWSHRATFGVVVWTLVLAVTVPAETLVHVLGSGTEAGAVKGLAAARHWRVVSALPSPANDGGDVLWIHQGDDTSREGSPYTAEGKAALKAFVEAVNSGAEMPVTGEDGLKSIAVGLAAKKSMAENRPVKVSEILTPADR